MSLISRIAARLAGLRKKDGAPAPLKPWKKPQVKSAPRSMCPDCGRTFRNTIGLSGHWREGCPAKRRAHEPRLEVELVRVVACRKCGRGFSTDLGLEEHRCQAEKPAAPTPAPALELRPAPAVEVVPPPVPPPPGFKARCRARDAATGRECQLLEGHPAAHVSPRGAFIHVLQPGQQSHRERLIETFGTARSNPGESL